MSLSNKIVIFSSAVILTAADAAARDAASSLKEVPYGVEALVQYRSEYRFRGFTLADDTIDLQLSSLYAFSDTTDLSTATWYGTATGSGQFSEFGLMAELSKQLGSFNIGTSATYRGYSNTLFSSGVNLEARGIWQTNEQLAFLLRGTYDTGAQGWYGDLSGSYLVPINKKSFIDLVLGLSAVSDYYDRNGMNDLFARLEYTYNINQSISLSPFIGASKLLDRDDQGEDSLHGGIYFAVSF